MTMHQITSAQFKDAIELDPAWASKLTKPVEITDYCDMRESKITHLSPLLHFTGENEYGDSAAFEGCNSLKIAEGKSKGFINFSFTCIEKIGDLSCGKDNDGFSATFAYCHSLKVAEGKFKGKVSFFFSDIEKIGDLSCGKDRDGIRLIVESCFNLKSIPISFNPKEVRAYPKLLEKLEVERFIDKKRKEMVEIEI